MNRVWPGDPAGTITERIVSWLDREVLSQSDVLMDLHTGGNAMDLIAMSMCHYTEDLAFRSRIRAAQRGIAPAPDQIDSVGPCP